MCNEDENDSDMYDSLSLNGKRIFAPWSLVRCNDDSKHYLVVTTISLRTQKLHSFLEWMLSVNWSLILGTSEKLCRVGRVNKNCVE